MNDRFRRLTLKTAKITASPPAFGSAVVLILLWLAFGPVFHWSDAHQLVINTVTTIITFLMTFLIQGSNERSDRATHIKLDELLRSHLEANSHLIGLEQQHDAAMDAAQSEIRSDCEP